MPLCFPGNNDHIFLTCVISVGSVERSTITLNEIIECIYFTNMNYYEPNQICN